MNAVDGATIERRIRINQPDEGRGRCKGSRAWDPRKDFSQCMQQPRTPSTSSAISPQQERTEPSGHRPCIHGTKSSLRREPNGPGDLLRALFGNVTEPNGDFCLRQHGSPAHAGMDLDQRPIWRGQLRLPRTRGDGPTACRSGSLPIGSFLLSGPASSRPRKWLASEPERFTGSSKRWKRRRKT